MSKRFRFREFELSQEKSAHRFGTDSMILGSVAELEGAMNVLDIGTGTGALALMMAQKHPDALVDAVEIDAASAEEATANFERSPWSFRLTCYAQSVQEFVADETLHYDLVLSNPPYFEPIQTGKGGNALWPDERRLNARTKGTLDFAMLMEAVAKVLVNTGRFYTVLPSEYLQELIDFGQERGLFPFYLLRIQHDIGAPFQRVVVGFCRQKQEEVMEETLAIYEGNGNRTEQYTRMTAAFHW